MIRDILIIQEYNLIKSLNSILFWIKKFPILGKKISVNLYRYILKLVESTSWISLIFPFVTKIISKLIFYGIIVLIIAKGEILKLDTENSNIILRYISLITLFGFMKDAFEFYRADDHSYYFIRQFKMKPKKYFIGYFTFSLIVFAFTFAIAISIIFSIRKINISFINIISFVVFSCSLRIFIALFVLKQNLKDKKIEKYESSLLSIYYISFILILIFREYVFNIINVDFGILYNPILAVIGILIILFSFRQTWKQNNFDEIIYPRLTYSLLSSKDIAGVQFIAVETQDEDIIIEKYEFSNYSGIKYINEIFFKRHERVYKKKTRFSFIIKCLIYIVISIGVFFIPISAYDFKFFNEGFFVILFASAYFTFNGNYFIKYCFYNMDYPLMKSNFYRKPEYIMQSMKIRFVKLLKNQSLPFILMIIMIICINIRFEIGTTHLFLSLASGILGVLFFTLHYLFAYYIIQPFTKDLEIKNPLYNGLTYFIYLSTYFMFSSDYIHYIFIALLIFSIVYIVLGFLGLKYLAPKRFKLR